MLSTGKINLKGYLVLSSRVSESLALGSETVTPLDLDKINELSNLWNARFEEFKARLSSSLVSSMSLIFQNFTNKSFSAPSQVPGDKSLGKRLTAPSPEEPHPGKSLGGNQEEQASGLLPPLNPSYPGGPGVPGPSRGGVAGVDQFIDLAGGNGDDFDEDLDDDFHDDRCRGWDSDRGYYSYPAAKFRD